MYVLETFEFCLWLCLVTFWFENFCNHIKNKSCAKYHEISFNTIQNEDGPEFRDLEPLKVFAL